MAWLSPPAFPDSDSRGPLMDGTPLYLVPFDVSTFLSVHTTLQYDDGAGGGGGAHASGYTS